MDVRSVKFSNRRIFLQNDFKKYKRISIIEYGSSTQGRSQDGPKVEDFKYLSKGKIFLEPTLSLSPLCLRTSKCLSMVEEVGTMQFRVQGEEIKNDERKK
jgi:hypothetical protein